MGKWTPFSIPKAYSPSPNHNDDSIYSRPHSGIRTGRGPEGKQRVRSTDGAIVSTESVCCDNRSTGYRTHTHTLTALRLSVYLIVLFILNFISVPNEIFVGICSFNLPISLIFILILFRNILDFSNLKFSHFSVFYVLF